MALKPYDNAPFAKKMILGECYAALHRYFMTNGGKLNFNNAEIIKVSDTTLQIKYWVDGQSGPTYLLVRVSEQH